MNDFDQLKCEQALKVNQDLNSREALVSYSAETLKNFAYRYIESQSTGSAEVHVEENRVFIQLKETNMVEALKCTHPNIKPPILEMAKRVSKKDNPSVLYRLEVEVLDFLSDGRGKAMVKAIVNWGTPEHQSKRDVEAFKQEEFSFDEPLGFRNILAAKLEHVCNIFT